MITKDKSPASGIQTIVVSASGACTAGSPEEVEQFITDQHSSDSQVCDQCGIFRLSE